MSLPETTAAPTTIDRDLNCAGCDYNLRGLDESAVCPECRTTVRESIALSGMRVLATATRSWRWLVSWGWVLWFASLGLAVLNQAISVLYNWGIIGPTIGWNPLLRLTWWAHVILTMVAVVLLTRRHGRWPAAPDTLRWITLALGVANLAVAITLSFLRPWLFIQKYYLLADLITIGGQVVRLAAVLAVLALVAVYARLAQARWPVWVCVMTGVTALVDVGLYVIAMSIVAMSRQPPVGLPAAVMSMVSLAGMVSLARLLVELLLAAALGWLFLRSLQARTPIMPAWPAVPPPSPAPRGGV